jgi:hypothetical protein
MKTLVRLPLALAACSAAALSAGAALYGDPPDERHAWAVHDMNRPRPAVVTPGAAPGQPPSDAVILLDGKSLDAWESDKDGSPCAWKFGDCQLHIEWRTPDVVDGTSQGRGNSGVFLMGTYELQVLDCFENDTYPDGQAGSVYAENPPLVNVCRKPGEWQTYDVVFHQPRWEGDTLVRPGSITVFQNGVLVQDHWLFEGTSTHRKRTQPRKHEAKLPLKLQDHGNPTRFRNAWIREIPDYEGDFTTGAYRKPAAILAQRKATAAKVRGEAEKILAEGNRVGGMQKLFEAATYEADAGTQAKVVSMAAAYVDEVRALDAAKTEARKGEITGVLGDLDYLVKFAIVPAADAPKGALQKIAAERGLLKKK